MEDAAKYLFQYLRDVLYAPDTARLDIEALPPELRELGSGMRFLGDCVKEQRTFLKALAKGDLSTMSPSVQNTLAAPAKELQGALRHLTWQTQQVAKGDYGQKVDFMGEFSTAFNAMTAQLQKRTAGLIAEKERVEQKNRDLNQTLELVLALTNRTHNMIFVFSAVTGREIFANRPAQWFRKASPQAAQILRERMTALKLDEKEPNSLLWETEVVLRDGLMRAYYSVESFQIVWGEQTAAVHILMDSTDRKRQEDLAHSLAYTDPLTGLNNRRYAMDRMNAMIASGTPFLLSFIDIDYLKYCNDNFGHTTGDHYLLEVVHILLTLGGDLCRVGGDEFILLQSGTDAEAQDRRLSQLRQLLRNQNESGYPKSFSFATTAVPAGAGCSVESYIQETDIKMYHYKKVHKRPLLEMYQDDRLLNPPPSRGK